MVARSQSAERFSLGAGLAELLRAPGRAVTRLWGRDVMLYVGGVSFFAMLAAFPGLTILVGLFSLLSTPEQATRRAEAFARLLPPGARDLFTAELARLGSAPLGAVSAQSGLALLIGAYAAHRGFKALLAGLSFVHDEDKPRGFVGFNIMALIVLVAAIVLLTLVSALFLVVRVISAAVHVRATGLSWIYGEWVWAAFGLTLGMTLIYRFAMSRDPLGWRASVVGGAAAAVLCLGASWASAVYVERVAHLGATYGSLTAVVVFLIWLSWTANAVFFGGALATEVELVLNPCQDPGVAPQRSVHRQLP